MVTAPVPPSVLPRPALDSHTHLDMIGGLGDGSPQGVGGRSPLAAARAAGIARVITVGTTLESSRWSAACAAEYDEVYAAVAIHPNEVAAWRPGAAPPPVAPWGG